MKTTRYVVLVAVVAFPLSLSNADEAIEPATSNAHRQLVGSWKASERLNRILGFKDDESRSEAIVAHPTSFRLVLDKSIGERMPAAELTSYRNHFRERQKDNRIVAMGKWETTFDVDDDPGLGTDCFVTEHRGSTFLLTPARFIKMYGGKISFIRGVDREHDVLVIDFTGRPGRRLAGRSRTPDTVAYKRSPLRSAVDKKKGSGIAAGQYTGASQLMIIGSDGAVGYDDTPLAISHLEITADDTLKAQFPDKKLGRGKVNTVTLKLSTNEPRAVWTAVIGKDTYKATAIPYSPKAYVFRLEITNNGKLIAGAQQFYAIEPK